MIVTSRVNGGNPAARDCICKLHAAGRADRIGIFTRLQVIRVAELSRRKLTLRLDLDDRQIGLLIRADDLRVHLSAVAELDRNALRIRYYMVIGDNVSRPRS